MKLFIIFIILLLVYLILSVNIIDVKYKLNSLKDSNKSGEEKKSVTEDFKTPLYVHKKISNEKNIIQKTDVQYENRFDEIINCLEINEDVEKLTKLEKDSQFKLLNIYRNYYDTFCDLKIQLKDQNNVQKELIHSLNEIFGIFEVLKKQNYHTINEIKDLKQNILKKLGDYVQKKIHQNQNPDSCENKKYVVCGEKACGLGCKLHNYYYCFNYALYTNRIMIFRGASFNDMFDVKSKCHSQFLETGKKGNSDDIVDIGIIDTASSKEHLPPVVPKEINNVLTLVHEFPSIWWIGNVLKYLLRPSKTFENQILKIDYDKSQPIVGIHIRRTDKIGTEAEFYSVEQYMERVEYWFEINNLTRNLKKKQIFVATDEPAVIKEIFSKYPNYNIYNHMDASKKASVDQRESQDGQIGIVSDMLTLANCDYIVGTFSSQVSRIAYELMNSGFVDKSQSYYSLDSNYYFGGGKGQKFFVKHENHQIFPGSSNDLTSYIGKFLEVKGLPGKDHFNAQVVDRKTNETSEGKFPEYAIVATDDAVEYKLFDNMC